MADSKIFKYANDISMNRSASSARSITTGGYGRTHRLGPSLVSFDVKLPLLTEEQYLEVENELLSIEDGIKFLEVNPSSNNGNNIISSNAIPLKPGETEIKVMQDSYSTLRQFVLTNLQPNTNKIFKVGDYIQFYNSSKVYQISKPIGQSGAYFNSTAAGTVKIRLSSPLVSNIGVSSNSSVGRRQYYQLVNGTATTYVEGLITIKNPDGTTAKDPDGNDLTIVIPNTNETAQDIYNYLNNTIMGTSSTHPVKTFNVWEDITSGNFTEYWGETNLDHVGSFIVNWGFEYDGCYLEYTTPTGDTATAYNQYEMLDDVVATLITDGITIENATETYNVGDYIQPQWVYPGTSYTKKILTVSTVGTTTTINFDTTFSSGTSGWYNYSPNNKFMRHQNDSLSSSIGLLTPTRITQDAVFYTSNYPVNMGNDINMKLMLTKKPAVTIVPKDEEQNLYVYDKFEFQEVL